MEFQEFPKIARLSRECVITEKIDGTNASVVIEAAELIADWTGSAATPWLTKVTGADGKDYGIAAGSRTRYITIHNDNHGWANWVLAHASELVGLGPGRHYGEWWGSGIQRGYGRQKGEKFFSLFNVARWHAEGTEPYISVSGDPRLPPKSSEAAPACCSVVPVLYRGEFSTEVVGTQIERLRALGSVASPGFMKPEGVICYHVAANLYFKKTIEKDAEHKSQAVA